MRMCSDIFAIREIAASEPVGYGGRFVATRPTRVGLAAFGYPRSAPDGTPVAVDGQRVPGVSRTRWTAKLKLRLLLSAPTGPGEAMKKSRFTEERIAYVLRLAEGGTPVADVCRQIGISDAISAISGDFRNCARSRPPSRRGTQRKLELCVRERGGQRPNRFRTSMVEVQCGPRNSMPLNGLRGANRTCTETDSGAPE